MIPWPRLPYLVNTFHEPDQDFGNVTVAEVGDTGDGRSAQAFFAFSDRLVRHLVTHNDRFTAVSIADLARPESPLQIDLIPQDHENVPQRYYSNVLSTVKALLRTYGFRELDAKVLAPFTESHLYITTGPEDSYEWTPPIYVDVPLGSDYIIEIESFNTAIDSIPGYADELRRGIADITRRARNAPFSSLAFAFDLGGERFHVQVENHGGESWARPLSNMEAFSALASWVKFVDYAVRVSHDIDLHDFEIFDAGPGAHATAVVAKGSVWIEGLSASAQRGNGSVHAVSAQEKSNGTVEVVS